MHLWPGSIIVTCVLSPPHPRPPLASICPTTVPSHLSFCHHRGSSIISIENNIHHSRHIIILFVSVALNLRDDLSTTSHLPLPALCQSGHFPQVSGSKADGGQVPQIQTKIALGSGILSDKSKNKTSFPSPIVLHRVPSYHNSSPIVSRLL